VEAIEGNAHHYIEIFSRAVDKLMPTPRKEPTFKDDVVDVIISQRSRRNDRLQEELNAGAPIDDSLFPPELTRRYTLNLRPVTPSGSSTEKKKAFSVRQVRGEHLGHLITVSGIATRVSDVKPSIRVNAYTCDVCGDEIFQPVTAKQFMPLTECPSKSCVENKTKGQLFLSTRASKFVPFQEVKIQEMADQVPVGHIPRQLTAHCHGALVRQINPGDVIDMAGIFLPAPYTGFKAMRAGLLTDTFLEVQHVTQHKKAYDDIVLAPSTLRRMQELERSGRLYDMLARSIAPEIFGHLDVKKALLLQLIGGVTKEMGDGMRIRGDINICLMGDPGVAKSQLLKYICKVAPRGIYTTGRGSSGVGLTAAVMRDPVTDEMVLEGGALVLADNGTCCIDEFDKMDDADRTSIHEVMEQQTISISKAGITTTLNARTSILAAANPLYGRYNPRISPVENINLPAALLSRFDVLFLLLDTPDRESDERLARHVAHVHMHGRHPDEPGAGEAFAPHELRQWIARARAFRPTVPTAVADYMVGAYVRMRAAAARSEAPPARAAVPGVPGAATGSANGNGAHVSPRTLLAVLRLSQALARLRFASEVVSDDVDEALRLLSASKASLSGSSAEAAAAAGADRTVSSRVYALVRQLRDSGAADADGEGDGVLDLKVVRERVMGKGFTREQFDEAVSEYAALDVSVLSTFFGFADDGTDLADGCGGHEAGVRRGGQRQRRLNCVDDGRRRLFACLLYPYAFLDQWHFTNSALLHN
jgi:DNA replication licensing factor MCM7